MFGYSGGSVEGYPSWGGSLGAYTSLGLDLGDLHHAAEDLLERALVDAGADAEGIEIERQVVQGSAAEVLIAAVSKDDLLVVGSRGHGGFADLLLGSVSQQCVHHAPCPVVVVQLPKPTAGADEQALDGEEQKPTLAQALWSSPRSVGFWELPALVTAFAVQPPLIGWVGPGPEGSKR